MLWIREPCKACPIVNCKDRVRKRNFADFLLKISICRAVSVRQSGLNCSFVHKLAAHHAID